MTIVQWSFSQNRCSNSFLWWMCKRKLKKMITQSWCDVIIQLMLNKEHYMEKQKHLDNERKRRLVCIFTLHGAWNYAKIKTVKPKNKAFDFRFSFNQSTRIALLLKQSISSGDTYINDVHTILILNNRSNKVFPKLHQNNKKDKI